MIPSLVRPLAVISGAHVHRALGGREKQIVELAEATYQLRAAGDTANARRTSCDSRSAQPRGHHPAGIARRKV
ncbi:MAG: hypothetical protein ACM3ZF_16560 [Mycobacterium leprae]